MLNIAPFFLAKTRAQNFFQHFQSHAQRYRETPVDAPRDTLHNAVTLQTVKQDLDEPSLPVLRQA